MTVGIDFKFSGKTFLFPRSLVTYFVVNGIKKIPF